MYRVVKGFVIFKDGEAVRKESDFGNAHEYIMVLREMYPNSEFELRNAQGNWNISELRAQGV